MRKLLRLWVFVFALGVAGYAQSEPQRVARLEGRVSTLESKVRDVADKGPVLMLFGAFCALWAQQSGRNSWLWFFLGLFFSVITVLVLLSKNAGDLEKRGRINPPS